MRTVCILIHRWAGLLTVGFLLVAATTGAIIAWEREVDGLLNPELYTARTPGNPLSPWTLIDAVEHQHPDWYVSYAPLQWPAGRTVIMRVQGRMDAHTGKARPIGVGEIFVDPGTGTIQGQRLRTAVSWQRPMWLPMLYRIHHSLHTPWGKTLMGCVAVVWTLDACVALYLAFPHGLRAWRKSLRLRLRARGFKLHFDLHRSGGVWLWLAFGVLSSTAITMNFKHTWVRPALRAVASLRPKINELPKASPRPDPPLRRQDVVARAAQLHGAQPGAVSWSVERGVYGVEFFDAPDDPSGLGAGGLGPARRYFDSHTGAPVLTQIPGEGSWADKFYDAQFPLHSGRILGKPGRVMITLLGMALDAVCVTGLLIWHRKRRARQFHRRRAARLAAEVAPRRHQKAS